MKTRETFPGKTYAVTSPNGCTVTTEDGLTLAVIEAGTQGFFVAVSGSVVLSDDSAIKTEVFKLAPYQKLRLLGVVGGNDGLPAGYTRLAYLESTGTQYIDTALELTNNHSVELTSQMTKTDVSSCAIFGAQIEGNQQGYALSFYQQQISGYLAWFFYKTTSVAILASIFPKIDVYDKVQISIDGGVLRINGQYITTGASGEFSSGKTCWLFARNSYSNPIAFYGKMFNFKVNRDGLVLNLQPALDTTGASCMFDTVTRKPFYNSGTGSFIAGIDTQSQLDKLLRRLPDRTGDTTGTLTVRLADALQTDANRAAMDAMVSKNWEITEAA